MMGLRRGRARCLTFVGGRIAAGDPHRQTAARRPRDQVAGRPSASRRVAERDGTAAELLPADEGQLDVSRGLRQQVGPCPAIRGCTTNPNSSIRPRPAFPASSASRALHPSQRPALERPLGLCRAASGRRTSGAGRSTGWPPLSRRHVLPAKSAGHPTVGPRPPIGRRSDLSPSSERSMADLPKERRRKRARDLADRPKNSF